MRVLRALLLLVVIAGPMRSVASDEIWGRGFTWGHDLHQSLPGQPHFIAAKVYSLNPRYDASLQAQEYTVLISGVSAGSVQLGNVLHVTISDCTFEMYRDATHSASYADNPPNGSVPGSFTDGTLYLGGQVSEFRVSFNPANNHGSFLGTVAFTAGEALQLLPTSGLSSQFKLIGGFVFDDPAIPMGFTSMVHVEVQHWIAFSVEATTWSAIKTLYQ